MMNAYKAYYMNKRGDFAIIINGHKVTLLSEIVAAYSPTLKMMHQRKSKNDDKADNLISPIVDRKCIDVVMKILYLNDGIVPEFGEYNLQMLLGMYLLVDWMQITDETLQLEAGLRKCIMVELEKLHEPDTKDNIKFPVVTHMASEEEWNKLKAKLLITYGLPDDYFAGPYVGWYYAYVSGTCYHVQIQSDYSQFVKAFNALPIATVYANPPDAYFNNIALPWLTSNVFADFDIYEWMEPYMHVLWIACNHTEIELLEFISDHELIDDSRRLMMAKYATLMNK